jgi:hypothetical protein
LDDPGDGEPAIGRLEALDDGGRAEVVGIAAAAKGNVGRVFNPSKFVVRALARPSPWDRLASCRSSWDRLASCPHAVRGGNSSRRVTEWPAGPVTECAGYSVRRRKPCASVVGGKRRETMGLSARPLGSGPDESRVPPVRGTGWQPVEARRTGWQPVPTRGTGGRAVPRGRLAQGRQDASGTTGKMPVLRCPRPACRADSCASMVSFEPLIAPVSGSSTEKDGPGRAPSSNGPAKRQDAPSAMADSLPIPLPR